MAHYYTDTTDYATLTEVVSLPQAIKQLKLEDLAGYDDDLVQNCIDAAIDEAENYCNTSFRTRVYKVELPGFIDSFEFKKQKVYKINSVTYKDADGNEVVLSDTKYALRFKDDYAGIIQFTDFDALPIVKADVVDAVVIIFEVGFEKNLAPEQVKQAIKLLLTDNYEYRGDRQKTENTAARIKLEPYKYYTT